MPNAILRGAAPVTRIELRSHWGDPWVDPPGILGGSEVNSGDPATMTLVKIGGSVETTASLYNIRRGDLENCSLREDPERRRGQRF